MLFIAKIYFDNARIVVTIIMPSEVTKQKVNYVRYNVLRRHRKYVMGKLTTNLVKTIPFWNLVLLIQYFFTTFSIDIVLI